METFWACDVWTQQILVGKVLPKIFGMPAHYLLNFVLLLFWFFFLFTNVISFHSIYHFYPLLYINISIAYYHFSIFHLKPIFWFETFSGFQTFLAAVATFFFIIMHCCNISLSNLLTAFFFHHMRINTFRAPWRPS